MKRETALGTNGVYAESETETLRLGHSSETSFGNAGNASKASHPLGPRASPSPKFLGVLAIILGHS
jgi:hypothetical protein